jgi:hypothetical protein
MRQISRMGMDDFPYQNIKAAVAQLEQQDFFVNWSPNPTAAMVIIQKGEERYKMTSVDLINLYLSGQLNESGLSRFRERQ